MPVHASAPSRVAVSTPRKPPHRFLTLLIMELVLIVSYPFTLNTGMRFDWFPLLAVLIIVAALYAALGHGKTTVMAFLLGTPAIVIHLANVAGHLLVLQAASIMLGIVFLGFVTTVFIRTVLSVATVTADTLAGAISVYL